MNTDNRQLVVSESVSDGKYTVQQTADGRLYALRHGKPWRDLTGDNLILTMAYEIETLRARLNKT